MSFSNQLAHVQLAAHAGFRRAGIAEVRVVLPHDDLGGPATPGQMVGERVERVGHVSVAQIPGRHAAGEHGAVVRGGSLHDAGVLFGVELVVLRQQTVQPGVAQAVALQLRQLLDDLPLTGLAGTERGGVPVSLAVIAAVLVEAGIALSRARRGLWVDALEVG